MRILILLLLLSLNFLFAQEVVVKQVWGDVDLIFNNHVLKLKNYDVFNAEGDIILKDKKSKIWLRKEASEQLIVWSEKKNKYSITELFNLTDDNHKKKQNNDKNLASKVFASFESVDYDGEKLSGMIVSTYSGVSRGDVLTSKIIDKLFILDEYPLKFTWGHLAKFDDGTQYRILVVDKNSKKVLFDTTTFIPNAIIERPPSNAFFNEWTFNLYVVGTDIEFVGIIESYVIKHQQREMLDSLKVLAIEESLSDECFYQLIFIDKLFSNNLILNGTYFLDLFIETNNNIRLIELKNRK
tara:strand:+ start:1266 stop:2156 length:891 start_codon:yes stop_codon:yes gene_type:complete